MIIAPPGFYGKIPSRGDFVGRRLALALAQPWDTWLSRFTIAVRTAAAAAWPEAWLTAPIWHFALGAAVAPEYGAAGILVASVDRVGRMFPFTIIGPADGIPEGAWFDAMEALVLAILDDDLDPDSLDASLIRLGPPSDGTPLDPGHSFWCCRGSGRVQPTGRFITGLPDQETAVAMVLGESTLKSVPGS
jgi:type VI secretion system protein ImpM